MAADGPVLMTGLQNDDGRNETDTKSSNETTCSQDLAFNPKELLLNMGHTSNHDVKASGGSLKDATNAEDTAAYDDGHATTDEIGKVASNDSAEESTLDHQQLLLTTARGTTYQQKEWKWSKTVAKMEH